MRSASKVQCACVVDDDIDRAERLGNCSDRRLDARFVAHIADHRQWPAAGCPHRVRSLGQRAGDLRIRDVGLGEQRDTRSVGGRADRDLAADAAAGAGDDDDAILQGARTASAHWVSFPGPADGPTA